MKKYSCFFYTLVVVSTLGFTKPKPITIPKNNHFSENTCHYGQCNAIAASTGNQCRHCVSRPGEAYCWQH